MERLSYEESYRRLQERGHFPEKAVLPQPKRMPTIQDDSPLGMTWFRTFVGEDEPGLVEDIENMTLPRTFFGRTEVQQASFKHTDLSESCLCWCDFTDVDFTKADLSRADLRASTYVNVLFVRADLSGADLRRFTYEQCDFSHAVMQGAKLTRDQADGLGFSDEQRSKIAWQEEDGEEPDGG